MQEPLRSHYLAALGIDNYVPRFILPAAKLSEPCEWIEFEDDSAAPITQPIDTAITVARNPVIESPPAKRIEPPRAPASAKTLNTDAEAVPKFALSIVLGGGLLLIDAAPVSNTERSKYQKLLNNMLPALRPAAAQYVLDIFMWPLTRQPQIARDAAAASETLAAYLSKQIQQRAIDTVLLLGETAQQWCTLGDNIRTIKSSSLLACVREPALKRQLWNDIRHLAER